MKQEQASGNVGEQRAPQIKDATSPVQSLISAFKAFSLYPEDHSISLRNFAKFKNDLESFLDSYETLRIEIGRNTFYFLEEIMFEGPAEENNPAYLLTRDGLEYIEFARGVLSSELSAFLKILNEHRNPFEESGGDIVTSFWQANFTHITYQEVDIFALESFQFELGAFRVTPSQIQTPTDDTGINQDSEAHDPGHPQEENEPESAVKTSHNLFLSEHGLKILEVTQQEEETLTALVQEEEQKNFTSDVIDILLIILVIQKNKVNSLQVLESLEFEFFETMGKGAFHLSYKLLNNITIIRNQLQVKKPWITSLLDSFISSLSSEEKFGQISWVQNEINLKLYKQNIDTLLQVLRLLKPGIIQPLGSLAGRIGSDEIHIRNELVEIIESKAKQEPEKLRVLLEKADEQTSLILAPAAANLPRSDAVEIFLQMTHHSSPEVRKMGLDQFVAVDNDPDFNKLLHLFGDDDIWVRDRIITYLFTAGEETAEKVLLRFLTEASRSDQYDQKIIFGYYKALASCASRAAVPFLEKMLLESKLSGMFNTSEAVHKKGAALALKTIGTEEAHAILRKGSQSLRPDVRMASQQMLK